jgi:hypothetical protein
MTGESTDHQSSGEAEFDDADNTETPSQTLSRFLTSVQTSTFTGSFDD